MRPNHTPRAWPVCTCGKPALSHRVYHRPQGSPCQCGLPPECHAARAAEQPRKRTYEPGAYWGIDGEGQGREEHRYVLLAASSEHGVNAYIENPEGLPTIQCLEFLLSLPRRQKYFGFSIFYDLTKILADLDNRLLYLLFHEELRQRPPKKRHLGPYPIVWKGFEINLQRTKFTLARGKERIVLWDVWRFFQSKFVTALESWGLGDGLEHMRAMKDARADFDRLSLEQIRPYCFDECARLGQLVRKLDTAHSDVGIQLRTYYGAGSTASAILKKLDIRNKRGDGGPEAMHHALACAFFGGRFENSVIGPIDGPVYSYDINSAYPYHITFLPCLQCGRWERTTDERLLERARTAIVAYHFPNNGPAQAWCPFPWRGTDGSICFPRGGTGWVWLKEYQAGKRLYPEVQFKETWCYFTDCECQPFAAVPEYYRERCRLGAEAAGIVLKLGLNSLYGKMAQSVGLNPPFQSWIWAGMITSGCRAQILEALALLPSPDCLLMVATDGIYTTQPIRTPTPRDTDTWDCKVKGKPKILGAWDSKVVKQGVFAARPGVYFPLNPSVDELKEVRARGLGKSVLHTCWESVVDAYRAGKSSVLVSEVTRFIGAKSAISVRGIETGNLSFHRSPSYGQWVKRPIELSFNPMPKRERADDKRLIVRTVSGASQPYSRAISMANPEAIVLRALEQEAAEQPDGGEIEGYEQ